VRRLALAVLLPAVALLAVGLPTVEAAVFADPAGAAPNTCALLTKKQASKVLGFKVVKTEYQAENASGAEQCGYSSTKYWKPRFKKLGAPLKLKITTQPLTDEVATTLDTLEADSDAQTVPGLGDRAFYNASNDLIVVVGNVVLQAEVTNIEWSGNQLQKYILDPERAAMDVLVPLFQNVKN
jgi:hypothetical protein